MPSCWRFFGHLVAYFIQVACAYIVFKKALGARRQYDILQQYSREGSLDCTGFVTKHEIHIDSDSFWRGLVWHFLRRSRKFLFCCFVETRQTHYFEYEYQVVDEENEEEALVYRKQKKVVYFCTLCREHPPPPPGLTSLTRQPRQRSRDNNGESTQPRGRRQNNSDGSEQPIPVPLKMLPGLPGSGYPTILVKEELEDFWTYAILQFLVGAAGFVLIPWLLLTFTLNDDVYYYYRDEQPPKGDSMPLVVGACVWSTIAGLVLARYQLHQWEEDTLRGGLQLEQHQETEMPPVEETEMPPVV